MDNFSKLPEECISEILSLTSPADVSASSTISKRFKSASDSDIAWNKFVPSDIDDIISKSSTPLPFELPPPSKKHLFLSLSDNPIALDAGKQMFYLDKCSGQKCVMIAPAELAFFGTNVRDEYPISRPDPSARFITCRFKEVAELILNFGVFDICFKMPNQMLLSKETHYSCYLMYKEEDEYHSGDIEYSDSTINALNDVPIIGHNKRVGKDGWEEIEIKSFFNNGANDDDEDIRASVGVGWDYEFMIIQGVEFRPRDVLRKDYSSCFPDLFTSILRKFKLGKFPPGMMDDLDELLNELHLD
ncbi:unnamed protein product [Cuscuta epithymum]|uniref:F-box domain-containing protein n=1 Tax=Cuscuta epithymum TaxID=186058 RepID=A0AAV0F2P0_9ASTE|nr:unnamed protein product [Cuscuta epithymum]